MALVKSEARDAELIFTPDSTDEERSAAELEICKLVSLAEMPAVHMLCFYDDMREVEIEVDDDLDGD
jgi:hypothetical protein